MVLTEFRRASEMLMLSYLYKLYKFNTQTHLPSQQGEILAFHSPESKFQLLGWDFCEIIPLKLVQLHKDGIVTQISIVRIHLSVCAHLSN